MKKKTPADARRFVEMVATHQGWELNPDKAFLADIVDGLAANFNRYGYFLCPCRDGSGLREHDKDIICPCDYNMRDQEEHGHCFCGLFLDARFKASGKPVRQIPERRPEDLDTPPHG